MGVTFETHSVWMLLIEGVVFLAVFAMAGLALTYFRRNRPGVNRVAHADKPIGADAILRIVEEAANDGLWYWDRQADFAYFSSRWKELLGFGEADIGNSSAEWFSRIHPADLDGVRIELYRHLCGESPRFECRHRVLNGAGSYCWVLARGVATRDESGAVTRIGGSLSDLSPLVQAEHRLGREVLRDELTRLPNRAYFMDMLGRCAARAARREDYQFAVLFMDLDRFKVINDTLGHSAGDEVLVRVAGVLEASIRPGDVVARLGGDEFTILLDDIESGNDATRIAARIISSLKRPIKLRTRDDVAVAASIGIALNDGQRGPEDLLRAADLAMYRAKARGRGRYEVFDRAMHSEAVARLRLEAEMRSAVDRREFQLFYQPVVRPATGDIHGVEVLMRWNHPTRGVMPADGFIDVANQTGLIVALGSWVLRESCHQVARWQAMFPADPPLILSVNFCRREMLNPDLFRRIGRLLQESNLSHGTLRIEISEGGIAESYDNSPETYHDLVRLGVGFQIDDFGTGRSSLSLLRRFPVSAVKIDRSFVCDVAESEDAREVIRYLSAVATAMGVEVIAEGVETEEQERWLLNLGCCSLAQGYRYSKPVSGVELEALLMARYRRKTRLAG